MKKITYVLILILSLLFIINSSVSAFDFGDNLSKDTDMHWAEENLDTLKALGVMNGYMGYTKPDDFITRGEFAAIITRAFGFASRYGEKVFADVEKDNVFFDSINSAYEAGIISGFDDNTFRPDNEITREQIVLMLSRLTPSNDILPPVTFTDIGKDYIYNAELSKITNDGIVGGYPDKSFRPYGKTTRAEAAKMIVSAMKKYMASTSQSQAIEIAKGFLEGLFNNSHTNATGSALGDSEYVRHTYEKAKELGYTLSNTVSDISFETFGQDGPFTSVTASYKVNRRINQSQKIYDGKSSIKLITTNGVTSVYEHNSRIIKKEPINLTWEVFDNPKNISTPGVNVVSPTCFRISTEKRSGNVVHDIYAENGDRLYFNSSLKKEYVDYAKDSGYEIWAMYKTDFDTKTASLLLNSPSARKQSFEKLLEYMLSFSLDGVNFDFENMYHTDKGAYTNHVREITLMAHTLGAIVSVDVNKFEPTSLNWSMCYDRDKLGIIADYMALMAYDQYYSGGKTAGPVSGLNWAEDCIKITLNEVNCEKLILGMPYYVRCWQVKDGKAVSAEAVSMMTAIKYIKENNATSSYDTKHKLTKYSWTKDDNEYVLWLEDANSIRERVKLSKKYNLAGVASWRRGFETDDVWLAIIEELGI